MIFEIDNVELYFKNKPILNGICLKAETGKVTSILGSNGCGKSCLLHIAFGNLTPKYKLIRLNGKPLQQPLYKTGFAKLLPQQNFIPKHLSVQKALYLFGLNWQGFVAIFDAIPFKNTTKIKHLSGGEKRLVELYVILKSKSEIVLLDEPFNGVSPVMIAKIQQLILQEKQHKIIILTDHRYTEVINTADVIYLLKNGCTKLINNLTELEYYKYLSVGTL